MTKAGGPHNSLVIPTQHRTLRAGLSFASVFTAACANYSIRRHVWRTGEDSCSQGCNKPSARTTCSIWTKTILAGDLRLQGKLKPDHLEHLVFSHHSLPPAHSICPSWVPGCRLSTAMADQPRQSQGYSGDKKQLSWKRQGEKLWEITHLEKGKGLSRSYSHLLSFCSGGSYTAR